MSKKIDYKVAEWREWRALTQVELAKRSRVHRNTISNMERGEHIQDPETIRSVAKALRVSIGNLRKMPSKVEDPDAEV